MTNEPMPDGGRRHVWTRGERLRAAREHMAGSPSQSQFAVMCGIARNSVVRYESDAEGADKPIVLMRWADVTGYSLDWLRYGDAQPTDDGQTSTPNTGTDDGGVTIGFPVIRAA